MSKDTHATKVIYEDVSFLNYSVTDVFSGWDRTINCFDDIVQLVISTGSAEQIAEMLNIISKYDIDLEANVYER